MLRFVWSLSCLVVFLLGSVMAYGAESSADVPFTEQQKNEVLSKMLGQRYTNIPRQDEYVIGHGDILTVSIFEEGDMSANAASSASAASSTPGESTAEGAQGTRVMMDGRISLKNIGDVQVVGLTLVELADYLKKLYSALYDNPIVTTTLVQSNSMRYTVMGEVTTPGIYPIDHPITLVQIVAQAGGFTEWANREMTLVRKEIKESEAPLFKKNTLHFDYDEFISGNHIERNIYLKPRDIIIVK